MKQLQKALAAVEKGKLAVVEIPIPEPDDYEVLIKNEGCTFCNSTDRMIIENLFSTPDYPVIIGHESFGRVIKVGKKVTKYKLGDRVICSNAIVNDYNGEYYSTWGGFAEYGIAGDLEAYLSDGGSTENENRYRRRYYANEIISGDLSYEQAALAFPLSEASSAIKQVEDLNGKNAVVIGAGIVGCFFTFFAKLYGAKKVTVIDINEQRLNIVKKLGADVTFTDAQEATKSIISDGGADIVFECSGSWRALENGLPYLKEGGTLAVYAVPKQPYSFDLLKCPRRFNYKRIDPIVKNTISEMCELLKEGKVPVDIFISSKFSIDESPEAYERVRSGSEIKSLVVFS